MSQSPCGQGKAGGVRVIRDEVSGAISLRFEEPFECPLPDSVVEGSLLLEGLLDAPGDVCLPLAPHSVVLWMLYSRHGKSYTADTLADALKVASFLNDKKSCMKLSQQLSELLVSATNTDTASQGYDSQAINEDTMKPIHLTLASLSEDLLTSVLTLTTSPSLSLPSLLCRLPASMHGPALRSTILSTPTTPVPTTPRASTPVDLPSPVPSFSLNVRWLPQNDPLGLLRLAAALPAAPRLHTLTIDSTASTVPDITAALAALLPTCPALETLRFSTPDCSHSEFHYAPCLLSHLSALRTLKHLDMFTLAVNSTNTGAALQHCSALSALTFFAVQVTDAPTEPLITAISNFTALQDLRLCHPDPRQVPDFWASLSAALARLPSLADLDVSGSDLSGDECAMRLASALSCGPAASALTSLALSDCRIAPPVATAVLRHLAHLPRIASLGLRGNRLPEGQGLAPLSSLTALTRLVLSDPETSGIPYVHTPLPLSALQRLQHLDLSACIRLLNRSEVMSLWTSEFSALHVLTYLDLSDNVLSGHDLNNLTSGLIEALNLPVMQHLDLSGNEISCATAPALAERLQGASSLRTLRLERNAIGRQGAGPLFRAIASLSGLQRLELGDNLFGTVGMVSLATQLHALTRLTLLGLEHVRACSDGLQMLAAHIGHLQVLRTLRVHDNGSVGEANAVLRPVVLRLPQLQIVNLTGEDENVLRT